MTEHDPSFGYGEVQREHDILVMLQAVRDAVAQRHPTVDEYDDWIDEPEKEFTQVHGRIIPQTSDQIEADMRTTRVTNARIRNMLARLYAFDIIPLDLLDRASREEYSRRAAEDAPPKPFLIENGKISHVHVVNLKDAVDAGTLKLYAYRTEKTTGEGYLEACGLEEFTQQLNVSAIYDHAKREEETGQAFKMLGEMLRDDQESKD